MPTGARELANISSLPPFPEGWYFLTTRQAVEKSKLVEQTWMGQNIVIWCDESGRISVAKSVCPHLGSQLGPAAGGRVVDGRLVCPFHGFQYDADGQCVVTPSAAPARSTRLRVFETREFKGGGGWSSPGGGWTDVPRNGTSPPSRRMQVSGATSKSGQCVFRVIPRRRARTRWTSPT